MSSPPHSSTIIATLSVSLSFSAVVRMLAIPSRTTPTVLSSFAARRSQNGLRTPYQNYTMKQACNTQIPYLSTKMHNLLNGAPTGQVGHSPGCLLLSLEIPLDQDVDQRLQNPSIYHCLNLGVIASCYVGDCPGSFLNMNMINIYFFIQGTC